ncbi:MAG: tRNA (adenosine(37)-N6)-dimethylallyltransferase MiaA [Rhodospirillaceae bacterium]
MTRGEPAFYQSGYSPATCSVPTEPGTVIVIGGPTASGKSGLALDLALHHGGTVINADSMQVYRELSILTARPGPESLAAAPHRLYGVLSGTEPCSAARWRSLALDEITAARNSGRLPIVVGGTGLYLRALIDGLSAIPDTPPEIREAIRARLNTIGAEALHDELAIRDPQTAARLKPGDSQRIARALEVLEATGQSLTDWQRNHPATPPPGLTFTVIVLDPPRAELYAACNRRFHAMIKAGAPEEVRALERLGLSEDRPVMKALGVPELRRHLTGALTLDEAQEQASRSTRHYAKRQVTWFKHQLNSPGP